MNDIQLQPNLNSIGPEQLQGFFEGWPFTMNNWDSVAAQQWTGALTPIRTAGPEAISCPPRNSLQIAGVY